MFTVEQSAADDADEHAEDRELNRIDSERSCGTNDNGTQRPEKINVRQFLDFQGAESETLRQNRLVLTRRHKAVASTQILPGCNVISVLRAAARALKSTCRAADRNNPGRIERRTRRLYQVPLAHLRERSGVGTSTPDRAQRIPQPKASVLRTWRSRAFSCSRR